MNLSHVERYFADFLSAMESKEGRLLLHREGRALPRKQGGAADVPEELKLPRNLFVIGTVNVDETTYMFSPKVLDRANVIEFRVTQGAPKAFLEAGGKTLKDIDPAPGGYAESFLQLSYRARGLDGTMTLALTADPANPPPDAKDKLANCRRTINELFELMQERHQEFAFRTMAEILRFLAVDYELTADKSKWDWEAAMDAQILQKILPKLHGARRKIGSLLAALARYCEAGDKTEALKMLATDAAAEAYTAEGDKKFAAPNFKNSHRKLCEMIVTVRRDQFVSFIQ
jgi:5-methylcytosine-specific restriction protein B